MSARHKWEPDGKRHVKRCVKCGCIKDETVLTVTRYQIDGVTHFTAPPCDGRLQTKIKTEQCSISD